MPYNTSYYQNYYLGLESTLNANIIYLWMNVTYYGTPFSTAPIRACPGCGAVGVWSLRKTPSQFNVIYNATRCG